MYKIQMNWNGDWEDISAAMTFSDKSEAEMNLENLVYLNKRWAGYRPDTSYRIVEIS